MFDIIDNIVIKMTDYCNLECKYCFQKKDSKKKANLIDIEDDIYHFIKKLPLSTNFSLKLAGGEVSIFPDKIKSIYKKFKKLERIKPIRFKMELSTNGTNIDDILDLIDKGIIDSSSSGISYDGIYNASKSRLPKNIDLYNDNFFNDVIRKIGKHDIASKNLCINTAITKDTISSLSDSVEFVLSSGCNKWNYYFITSDDSYNDKYFLDEFETQIRRIVEIYKKNVFTFYNAETVVLGEYLNKKDYYNAIRCKHLGKNIMINQKGDIFPCTYFDNSADFDNEPFIIGNIYDGFYKNKLEELSNQFFKISNCQCNNYHCIECPATAMRVNGQMSNKLKLYCKFKDIEREVFKSLKSYYTLDYLKTIIGYDNWDMKKEINLNLPFKEVIQ